MFSLALFRPLFSRRWLLPTLLVVLIAAIMVRLGIWQLDRLEQRRARNAQVTEMRQQPPLALDADAVVLDLEAMEYRQVEVTGAYDFDGEVVNRNQVSGNSYGVHIYTPLVIAGSDYAVLVNRGWIPQEQASPAERAQYAEAGQVTVQGVLRRFMDEPKIAGVPDPTLSPGETRLDAWNFILYDRMQAQIDHPLLPVYIEQTPAEGDDDLPQRYFTEVALDEGSHLGYALQWFSFALIALIGYPIFVRKQEERKSQDLAKSKES